MGYTVRFGRTSRVLTIGLGFESRSRKFCPRGGAGAFAVEAEILSGCRTVVVDPRQVVVAVDGPHALQQRRPAERRIRDAKFCEEKSLADFDCRQNARPARQRPIARECAARESHQPPKWGLMSLFLKLSIPQNRFVLKETGQSTSANSPSGMARARDVCVPLEEDILATPC
jgi:hypothetical protein